MYMSSLVHVWPEEGRRKVFEALDQKGFTNLLTGHACALNGLLDA